MNFRTVVRGDAPYFRVAKPEWDNPLDTSYSQRVGGRWNPKDSFPVLYLNASVAVAKSNVRYLHLDGAPWDAEDLDPGPLLVQVGVPTDKYVDAVSRPGLVAMGLSVSYPEGVAHDICQALGQQMWDNLHPGVACLSAAAGAPVHGEELAWFDRDNTLPEHLGTQEFASWYL